MIGCALSLGGRQFGEQKTDTLNGRSGMSEDAKKAKRNNHAGEARGKNRQRLLRLKPVI
jgi:hypothetical protein